MAASHNLGRLGAALRGDEIRTAAFRACLFGDFLHPTTSFPFVRRFSGVMRRKKDN
jgi:hypothetical protein